MMRTREKTVFLVLLTIFAVSFILLYVSYRVSKIHFDCEPLNKITDVGCRFLPDILIVGFDKCGTMTLRQFLSVHSDIFNTRRASNIQYFKTRTNLSNGLPKKTECTPEGKLRLGKLVSPEYPENVHKCVPNVKLIAIVKEPTERVMSNFVHSVVQHGTPMSMKEFDKCTRKLVTSLKFTEYVSPASYDPYCEDVIGIINTSMYVTALKPWVEVFGVENILIIDGDNFVANPVQELKKAEQFFGLKQKITQSNFYYDKEKKFYCYREEGNTGCMSEKKGRPHPAMANSTRKLLKDFYKPYNEELYKLIGRTFPWDN